MGQGWEQKSRLHLSINTQRNLFGNIATHFVGHESIFLANENKIPSELLHDFCVNQGLEYVLPATTENECSEFTAGLSEVSRVIQTRETETGHLTNGGMGRRSPGFLSLALTLVIVSAPCSRLFLHSQPP